MTSLHERRAGLQAEIGTLIGRMGAACLDDETFDHTELDRLERELLAVDAAEGVAVQREREAAAKAEAERRAVLRSTLEEVEVRRLDACEQADKAAQELCKALSEIVDRAADAVSIVRALGIKGQIPLNEYDLKYRLGQRVTNALKPLLGTRRSFGQIDVPEAQTRYAGPWREAEQAAFEPFHSQAMKVEDA